MSRKSKRITEKAVQSTEDTPAKGPGNVSLAFKPEDEPEDHGYDVDGLTERQRAFVDAYVGPAAGNATKAAKLAGYSDSNRHILTQTGSRLLTFVNVQRALARARAEKLGSPEWTRAGIVEIADANVAAFYKLDANGKLQFDLEAAYAAGAMGLVKEITEDVLSGGDGPVTVIRRKIKLHDRTAAQALLAKINGMLVDRVEDVTPPKPSPVSRLLTSPAAFRAARQLAAAMGHSDHAENGNGHDPARN